MSEWHDHFYQSADGLRLHARDYRAKVESNTESSLPVVCLPGLTRNARDFHPLALKVSAGEAGPPRRVIAFDYRGRGESDRDPDPENYTVPTEAQDIVQGLQTLQIESAIFIGTSRGALILHVLIGLVPNVIAASILNDAGPELNAGGLRDIRHALTGRSPPADWAEAVERMRTIYGSDFPILEAADWRELAEAIFVERHGKLVADCDPAITAALQSLDLDSPLPTLWEQFDALAKKPVLVVRGENSTLLTADILTAMQRRQPAIEALKARGQGHAPLLHLPGVMTGLADFLVKRVE